MRAWRCSVLPWLKLFPQASQEKSFSPVCVRMWMVRWLLLLKRLPQVWQGKGLSPVCVRVCRSSVLLWPLRLFAQPTPWVLSGVVDLHLGSCLVWYIYTLGLVWCGRPTPWVLSGVVYLHLGSCLVW
uniref:Uncharacterized protein n=1 Tax=Oryzias latipes TaxID=8090 RepID=A0A3P9L1X5_ORYLA